MYGIGWCYMSLTNDVLKRDLAQLLWREGFGDDPFRNWRMAELMIIDEGFLAWWRQALVLAAGQARSESAGEAGQAAPQALGDFLTGVAYWIFVTSLGLDQPSCDPQVNWRIAEALRGWLCSLDFSENAV